MSAASYDYDVLVIGSGFGGSVAALRLTEKGYQVGVLEAGRRFVRDKSLRALKDKVRERTRRSRGDSLARIVADLNPMLRGWFGYFKHARPGLFRRLDQFIRRRLRAILRKQDKRPSMGRNWSDHVQWPNAYFADLGLFTLKTAWETARHSR